MLRALPLDRLLGGDERLGTLVRAMIVARIIEPVSKLATAKALSLATAASSLAPILALGEVDADELYAALDWLLERQPEIEAALAKRHLADGTLVLYDVSSSWLEGRCCPLARFGHSQLPRRKPGQAEQIADRLWPVMRRRRLSGGDRGLRGQYRRPNDAVAADRQSQRALRVASHRPGRRSRHDHPGPHR